MKRVNNLGRVFQTIQLESEGVLSAPKDQSGYLKPVHTSKMCITLVCAVHQHMRRQTRGSMSCYTVTILVRSHSRVHIIVKRCGVQAYYMPWVKHRLIVKAPDFINKPFDR